jgi:hypothetical protein
MEVKMKPMEDSKMFGKNRKTRRINKIKIKIAGLRAEVEILRQLVRTEHTSYDRDELISKYSKLSELETQLDILSYPDKHVHKPSDPQGPNLSMEPWAF